VTAEEFEQWKVSDLTREVMGRLEEVVDEHKESWANHETLMLESVETTAIKNAYLIGKVDGLRALLAMDYEDV